MKPNMSLMAVPFYDDTLVLIDHNGQPYVAMRPVVEALGLSWQVQHRKLGEKFASTVTILVTVGEDGRQREMVCLSLRKFPAWLYSISPNKLAANLRQKVLRYQEESEEALWQYWTGQGPMQEAHAPQDVKMFVSCMRESTFGNPLAILYLEKHHGLVMPEKTAWRPLSRRRKSPDQLMQEKMDEMARNAPAFVDARQPEPEPEAAVDARVQEADEEYAAWLKQQVGPRGE